MHLLLAGYENAVDALPKEVTIDEAVGGSGVTFHDVTARERCFLALGAVYPSIARGMAWKSIAQSLQRDGVVPIEADATELQSHIEEFQAYMRQVRGGSFFHLLHAAWLNCASLLPCGAAE